MRDSYKPDEVKSVVACLQLDEGSGEQNRAELMRANQVNQPTAPSLPPFIQSLTDFPLPISHASSPSRSLARSPLPSIPSLLPSSPPNSVQDEICDQSPPPRKKGIRRRRRRKSEKLDSTETGDEGRGGFLVSTKKSRLLLFVSIFPNIDQEKECQMEKTRMFHIHPNQF